MTTQSDRYAVVCNIAGPDKVASDGAKAWVTWMTNPGWDHDRLVVLIRSRGGRHVQRWTTITRLRNFRAVAVPVGHPRYSDDRVAFFDGRSDANALAERLIAARKRNTTPR